MSNVQLPNLPGGRGNWRGCNGHMSVPLQFSWKNLQFCNFPEVVSDLELLRKFYVFGSFWLKNCKSRRGLVFATKIPDILVVAQRLIMYFECGEIGDGDRKSIIWQLFHKWLTKFLHQCAFCKIESGRLFGKIICSWKLICLIACANICILHNGE